MTDLDGKAQILDLEARVQALERAEAYKIPDSYLASFYLDAAMERKRDPATARHWIRQLMSLDVKTLLSMARQTMDPFPWQPLLHLADDLATEYPEAVLCVKHVEAVAAQLLAAQGLYPVMQVREIGEYAPLHVRAFHAIRSKAEIAAMEDA
jgi:hypothetical protein